MRSVGRRPVGLVLFMVLAAAVGARALGTAAQRPATAAASTLDRGRTDAASLPDIVEHFKYGSIGAEEGSGLPYRIWRVLPDVCGDALPKRPGKGYERIGFIADGASGRMPGSTTARRSVPAVWIPSTRTRCC